MQARGKKLLEEGRPDEARKELHDAFDRHVDAADHAGASTDAFLLSRAHSRESRYDEALRWADKSRVEADKSGQENLIGRAINWFGNLHGILGDVHRAAEAYKEAKHHLSLDDKAEYARMRIYQGRTEGMLGHGAESAQLLEEGYRLADEANEQALARGASINLAALAIQEGRHDDAERHLVEAKRTLRPEDADSARRAVWLHEAFLARARGRLEAALELLARAGVDAPPDTAWEIARERALIAEQADRLDEAERFYGVAIDIVEEMRRNSASWEVRAPFLEERWEPFGNLFDLRLRRGDARGAFATLALAQGRMFLDALVVSLAEEPGPPDRAAAALARLKRLEEIVPLLAGSSLGGAPPRTPELPALRGRHVLAYFSGRGRMRLLSVVDGQPRATSVDIGLDQLDRLLDDFYAHPDDERKAAALGAALLPADALPPAGGRLHVVPTGLLLRLPFAALRVASGRRLVDRHEVVYVPSVTALAAMVPEGQPSADGPRVVLADSGGASTSEELGEVVARTGASRHVGPKATAAALLAAKNAYLLHVISHSGQDPRGGYLALPGGQRITAANILEWTIRPRLVVLPTCGSARTVRGEMWDSLATAFLASGSEHVVATLASVKAPVAAEFSRLFYAQGGLADPVGATARAQREMARTRGVAAWSAFMVAGL